MCTCCVYCQRYCLPDTRLPNPIRTQQIVIVPSYCRSFFCTRIIVTWLPSIRTRPGVSRVASHWTSCFLSCRSNPCCCGSLVRYFRFPNTACCLIVVVIAIFIAIVILIVSSPVAGFHRIRCCLTHRLPARALSACPLFTWLIGVFRSPCWCFLDVFGTSKNFPIVILRPFSGVFFFLSYLFDVFCVPIPSIQAAARVCLPPAGVFKPRRSLSPLGSFFCLF